MKIYHFTDKEIKTVKVEHFGENLHTFNDTKISNIERSFFYTSPKACEYRFENKKCYVAEVDSSEIYNLTDDEEHYIRGFKDLNELLKFIKKRYIGIIYKVRFEICVLFEDIEVTEYKEH